MLALQILSIALILVSALCFFGPQIALYGWRGVADLTQDTSAKAVASVLLLVAVVSVVSPYSTSGISQNGISAELMLNDASAASEGRG